MCRPVVLCGPDRRRTHLDSGDVRGLPSAAHGSYRCSCSEGRSEANEEEVEDEDEEFELDDAPAGSPAASLVKTWETIGKLGFWPGLKPSSTPRGRSSRMTTPLTKGNGTDPRTRLRAITAELNNRKPRGPAAVKLLVEAAPYLTGGVNALAQYGEARGCRPEDVVAAERTLVGRGNSELLG